MTWLLPPVNASIEDDRLPSLPTGDRNWLTPILDTDAVSDLLTRICRGGATGTCRRLRVRYRPGADCSVLYAVVAGDGTPTYFHVYANAPTRALPDLDSEATTRPGTLLGAAVAVPGMRAVVREFPDDPLLPGLALLHEPRTLAAALRHSFDLPSPESPATFRLLRYKPGLRAVLRLEATPRPDSGAGADDWSCVVRFEDPRVAVRESATVAAVAAALPADGRLLPPPPVRRAADGRWSCRAWIPGSDLGRDLRGAGSAAAANTCGQALAGLQGLHVECLNLRSAEVAIRELARQVDAIVAAGADPEPVQCFTSAMRDLLALAAATAPGPLTLVHGDFHQGQLVPCGERLAVLDWDRAHLGEAAEDHGNFAAQTWLLEQRGKATAATLCDAFRAGFEGAGGRLPDAGRVRLWTCLAIAGLAVREVRRLRPDWPSRAMILLGECRRQAMEVHPWV